MKVIKHPLSSVEKKWEDVYCVTDAPYNGSSFVLNNLEFGDDNNINFNFDIITLFFNNMPVTDVFLIHYHFEILQKNAGELVVNAMNNFMASQETPNETV